MGTDQGIQKWAEILKAQAASGQSKKDFCAEQGINAATFYTWQRKLRDTSVIGDKLTAGFMRLTPGFEHELTICLAQGEVKVRSHSCQTLAQVLQSLDHA